MSKEKPNHEYRAWKAWPILTERAAQGEKITYKELGHLIKVRPRVLGLSLAPIQDYCMDVDLPPLTILVINERTGKPGSGFIAWSRDDIQGGTEKVWGSDWNNVENPFEYAADGKTTRVTILERLSKELLEKPAAAAQTPEKVEQALFPDTKDPSHFARVRVRGTGQAAFRDALVKAYRGRCAFCGLKVKEALEAAHIIPWAYASPSQRFEPSNGVLLCATHHKLFDHGYLGISETGEILCSKKLDETVARSLRKKSVFSPANVIWRPDHNALRQHRERHKL